MLYILFNLGKERFALPCRNLVRIIPMVRLKELPQSPSFVAGLLNYRGSIIPVIDLCVLVHGHPADARLSSRIMLVNYRGAGEVEHILGLLAEAMTETMKIEPKELAPSGLTVAGARYLGQVASTEKGMIQIIEVDQLLPQTLKDSLFQTEATAA